MAKRHRSPIMFSIFVCVVTLLFLANLVYSWMSISYTLVWGAIAYSLLIGHTFSYSKLKQPPRKEFRDKITEVAVIGALIFVLFLFGTIAQNNANSVDTTLNASSKGFQVLVNPPESTVLNSFSIYYDFKKQKGELNFDINKPGYYNHSLDSLSIWVPKGTSIDSWSNSKTLDEYEIDIEDNRIYFTNAKKVELSSAEVVVRFSGDIKPNGRFSLYSNTHRTFSQGDTTMIFELGNFECRNICFANAYNTIYDILGDRIVLKYSPQYYAGIAFNETRVLSQSITLNTLLPSTEDRKNNLNNFAMGLFVASMVLFGEIIRRVIVANKDW